MFASWSVWLSRLKTEGEGKKKVSRERSRMRADIFPADVAVTCYYPTSKPVTPEVAAQRSSTCSEVCGMWGEANDLQLLLAMIEPRRAGISAIE